jgi:hypothetical protein
MYSIYTVSVFASCLNVKTSSCSDVTGIVDDISQLLATKSYRKHNGVAYRHENIQLGLLGYWVLYCTVIQLDFNHGRRITWIAHQRKIYQIFARDLHAVHSILPSPSHGLNSQPVSTPNSWTIYQQRNKELSIGKWRLGWLFGYLGTVVENSTLAG